MKRKYAAVFAGLILGAASAAGASATGFAQEAAQEDSQDIQEQDNVIFGEVTAVGASTIAIAEGSLKQGAQPGVGGELPEGEEAELPEGEIPELPEGERPELPEGQEPEAMPEDPGEAPGGERPSMLELTGEELEIAITEDTEITRQTMGQPGEDDQEGETVSLEDIQEGDTVSAELDEDGNAVSVTVLSFEMAGQPGGGPQGSGGNSQEAPEEYEAVEEYTEDTEAEDLSVESTGTDENGVLVSEDAQVTLKGLDISRISQDSTGGDASSFYGVGAAFLAVEGDTYISEGTIDTDAAGGAGIFSYGDAVVYAADTSVATEQDTSGGIHAAGGGTLYAWNLDVETKGESSAAIRSDRGGGLMVVDGGTYLTKGTGSPAVYSTADITVHDSSLTAENSEAVCIEGENTIRLFGCSLDGNMMDDSRNDCTWNVILYQSMSGDSEEGNSTFEMSGGTLRAGSGGMFYTTNTESTFILRDVNLEYSQENPFFLRCTGNNNERGWGTSGSNGANCTFTAVSQNMQGDVIWDSISDLDFYMTEGSTLEGAVVQDEANAGSGGAGYCNVYVSEDSVWTVAGDSTVTCLYNAGTITDQKGNSVTIQGTDGTVYAEGTSEYTITAESYAETADLSGASQGSSWEAYEMEKPQRLA